MDRDWDDMTDAEWEAYEERVYQEQLEEIKQTVRVTLPCPSTWTCMPNCGWTLTREPS